MPCPPKTDSVVQQATSSTSSHGKNGGGPLFLDLLVVTKQLRALFEDYAKLLTEAKPLSNAIEMVSEKLHLMRASVRCHGRDVVLAAIVSHSGALEGIMARLIGRMEGFLAESRTIYHRFDVKHRQAMPRCRASVQLWLNRWEVGAEFVGCKDEQILELDEDNDEAEEEETAGLANPMEAARVVLDAMTALEEDLQVRREQVQDVRYLDRGGSLRSELRKPSVPAVQVDVVLKSLDAFLAGGRASTQWSRSAPHRPGQGQRVARSCG
eukprot:TRINITY_DN15157_c0_g1_i1.p1 TRINITY_DN15157_c0_g1~~TRINITY_DN15157_c0_g1_i1.p1  ORF type:complete len:267 (+),score=45.21 TRINITY_DN15157_c0_g1_i1:60-860(+)